VPCSIDDAAPLPIGRTAAGSDRLALALKLVTFPYLQAQGQNGLAETAPPRLGHYQKKTSNQPGRWKPAWNESPPAVSWPPLDGGPPPPPPPPPGSRLAPAGWRPLAVEAVPAGGTCQQPNSPDGSRECLLHLSCSRQKVLTAWKAETGCRDLDGPSRGNAGGVECRFLMVVGRVEPGRPRHRRWCCCQLGGGLLEAMFRVSAMPRGCLKTFGQAPCQWSVRTERPIIRSTQGQQEPIGQPGGRPASTGACLANLGVPTSSPGSSQEKRRWPERGDETEAANH